MSYRYRRIDVRKGRLLWQARPVSIDRSEGDQTFTGMDLVPTRMDEVWWFGFTRQHAIARAYRWAKRQNRRADRGKVIESHEFEMDETTWSKVGRMAGEVGWRHDHGQHLPGQPDEDY